MNSEVSKECDIGPPLYVSGKGETFEYAIAYAEINALAALPIEV